MVSSDLFSCLAMATSLDRLGFPVLKIRHDDVAGSWNEFYEEFMLVVEFARYEKGTEIVNGEEVNRFTDRAKLLALLKCIGADGRSTLSAKGYSIISKDLTFDIAIDVLRNHLTEQNHCMLELINL